MVNCYWRAILARAFRDSLRAIRYESAPRLMLTIFFGLAVILGLYLLGSPDAWKDESIVKAAPFALALIGFPAIFLWSLLSAPARIHAEQNQRIATLKAALEPTLRVSIAEGGGFSRADYGLTSTSMNGTKQTVVFPTGRLPRLLVNCENISDAAIERCEAFIVEVRRQDLQGVSQPIKLDAIPLWWMPPQKARTYQTSIPSRGHRSAVALNKIGSHVYLPTDDVPADLIRIFDEPGTFLIRIMVCPYGAASVSLIVRLVTGDNPTVEPVIEG